MKPMASFWCLSAIFILFLISNSFAGPEDVKVWYVFVDPSSSNESIMVTGIVLCPTKSARMNFNSPYDVGPFYPNCKGQVGQPAKLLGILHQIEDVESVRNSNENIKKAEDRLWHEQINPALTQMKKDLKKEIMEDLNKESQADMQKGK